MERAESAQRALLLTGQREDAEQYRLAVQRVPLLIERLAALTSDNASQRSNILVLRQAAEAKLAIMAKLVALAERGHRDEAVMLLRTGVGRDRMTAVQTVIARMAGEEERLLSQRADMAERMHARAQHMLWGALGLGVLLILVSGLLAVTSVRTAAQAASAVGLRERGRQQERVAALGREALSATDFQRFAKSAMAALTENLGAHAALLVRQDAGRSGMIAVGLDDAEAEDLSLQLADLPLANDSVHMEDRSGKPVLLVPIAGAEGRFGVIALPHGSGKPFSQNDMPFVLAIGNLIAAAAQRDADRQALLDSLHHADAVYQAYFENTAEALFVVGVDPDGEFRILGANPVYEATTGRRMREFVGQPLQAWLPPTILNAVRANLQHCCDTGRPYRLEEALVVDGGMRIWDTVLVPVFDRPTEGAEGRVFRIVGSGRDITDQRLAQDRLRHAQKMEALGQLTGGVAHDVNNLLTPIVGGLDLLRRRISDDRGLRLIDGALASAQRVQMLVQRMLGFARRQHLQPQPVDVGNLIDSMLELLSRSVGPQVQVLREIPSGLPPALVDPNQLELALLNLSVNARDAMPEGGTLTIDVALVHVDAEAGGELAPGQYLRLSVTDTGLGMDAATLARASEPFFTTKAVGHGTGLGLSLVHGLAEQSGGRFLLTSTPGVGTRAELMLPATEARASAAVPQGPGQNAEMRPARILLVDDEDLVRSTAAESLRELGHQIIEANSGPAALETIRGSAAIDLLVTDHMMPGMTGEQLALKMREHQPDLPVLLVTGYANLASSETKNLTILLKPFRPAELGRKVAELLA
ncbi:hypothetical protein A7X12_22295 [Sphingomonas sp. TDK1]|nr:hypothetical protein A7X12_22295 [Sphingomonas sp. TDK1]